MYVDRQYPRGVGHFLCFNTSKRQSLYFPGGGGGYVLLVHDYSVYSSTDVVKKKGKVVHLYSAFSM